MGWPWIVGPKPEADATANAKLEFLNRGIVVVVLAMFFFSLAVVGAMLIVRQARAEYSEARTENLKELIEGTQEDIRKKKDVSS